MKPLLADVAGRVVGSVAGLLVVLYPVLVYFGLQQNEPRLLALLLLLVLGLRMLGSGRMQQLISGRYRFLLGLLGLFLVLLTFVSNQPWGLRLYPLLVNLGFLSVFAWSLRYPPSIIERLARLREPDLPEPAVAYTRNVTKLWCGFFIFNGLVSLYTALFSSLETWTLYNGAIAYLLMGILFAGELLWRKRMKQTSGKGG